MLQVSAKYAEINLRIYGPQVVTAAHTLSLHPTSKIAKENVEGNGNSFLLELYNAESSCSFETVN
jgi:hypothetical protein